MAPRRGEGTPAPEPTTTTTAAAEATPPAESPPPPPPPPSGGEGADSNEPDITIGEPRDRDPYHRNDVNSELHDNRTYPERPSDNLEIEQNYSREEEIKSLVERVRTGYWEREQEQNRLKALYGNPGLMRRAREFLSGERDLRYDEVTGRAVYRWQYEVGRRALHVGINAAEAAAISGAVTVMTGGSGALLAPAIIGSSIGRGVAQAWRGLSGVERGMREEILIARQRYYAKARELADRVGEEEAPDEIVQNAEQAYRNEHQADPPETVAQEALERYRRERNAAIRSLVDFVYESEQNGVNIRRDANGRPYNDTDVFGEPLPPGDREQGEPIPGGPRGPAIVRGTEVYQQSDLAPKPAIDDMENKLQAYKTKWEWIETGLSLVGGMGAVAREIIVGKMQEKAFEGIVNKLASGEAVRLDIDGNWIRHAVQLTQTGIQTLNEMAAHANFLYNSTKEAMMAAAHGDTVTRAAHFLGETGLRLGQAISNEAWRQVIAQAGRALSGVVIHSLWRGATTEMQQRNYTEQRKEMKDTHEVLRRRHQPESRMAGLQREAMNRLKTFPQAGQEWYFQDDDGLYHTIEILNVIDDKDQPMLRVKEFNPDGGPDIISLMTIEDLLARESYEIDRGNRRGTHPVRPEPPIGPDGEANQGGGSSGETGPDGGEGEPAPPPEPEPKPVVREEENAEEPAEYETPSPGDETSEDREEERGLRISEGLLTRANEATAAFDVDSRELKNVGIKTVRSFDAWARQLYNEVSGQLDRIDDSNRQALGNGAYRVELYRWEDEYDTGKEGNRIYLEYQTGGSAYIIYRNSSGEMAVAASVTRVADFYFEEGKWYQYFALSKQAEGVSDLMKIDEEGEDRAEESDESLPANEDKKALPPAREASDIDPDLKEDAEKILRDGGWKIQGKEEEKALPPHRESVGEEGITLELGDKKIDIAPGQRWSWKTGSGEREKRGKFNIENITKHDNQIEIKFEGFNPIIRPLEEWQGIFEAGKQIIYNDNFPSYKFEGSDVEIKPGQTWTFKTESGENPKDSQYYIEKISSAGEDGHLRVKFANQEAKVRPADEWRQMFETGTLNSNP